MINGLIRDCEPESFAGPIWAFKVTLVLPDFHAVMVIFSIWYNGWGFCMVLGFAEETGKKVTTKATF